MIVITPRVAVVIPEKAICRHSYAFVDIKGLEGIIIGHPPGEGVVVLGSILQTFYAKLLQSQIPTYSAKK